MRGIGNDLVREARKRAGLTQRQLAELAGTTQSALARVESGRTAPSFDQVLRLVRLCGLDLDIMLVERDDSDYAQASRLRDLTAQERWTRAEQVADQMRQFREAGSRGA
ncbi:helix-turn-helix transcriptional regulator [Mycolicibacter heraklionensis]|uniref:helix-turn-helix transcriptional regulator n=1 Tax=Mycolicibacter heraklionensis TaxID=512402 RepID=UPI000B2114C2|nr:helix-turn-helix transcriptional regulator [Mycolicibacter heraklionensis]